MKVNMTPNPLDVVTIHASQGDTEARQWEFELHNNGELIDTSEITEQLFFKAYKGGTEQILPENTSTPTTSPFLGDIKYPQGLLADQEFTYRQSPTEEDGNAKITDIKGNTLVWNQLVQNGNFADGTNNWTSGTSGSTISVANGELTVTINGAWNNDARQSISMIANHKYLGCFSVKGSVGVEVKMQQFGSSANVNICKSVTLTTSYQRVIGIATPSQSSVGLRTTIESNASSYTGQTYTIKDVMFIDLTQMGLDITDPSEFTSLFPLSYYAYNQGTLLSFNGNGIKTVGKNLLNYNWLVPSSGNVSLNLASDYFEVSAPSGSYRSAILNCLEHLPKGKTLYISANSTQEGLGGAHIQVTVSRGSSTQYIEIGNNPDNYSFIVPLDANSVNMIFYVSNGPMPGYGKCRYSNVIVSLSPITSFDPYTSSTLSLPISTYFSNGMKSAGSVYDELTETKAITRVGSVDLGSLTWNGWEDNGSYIFFASITDKKVGRTTPCICPLYEYNRNVSVWADLNDKQITGSPQNSAVYIRDSSYTDATAFKTAMSGVYVYYELATPTETLITTASLVTENAEIPLSNEDGVLIGKCTEQLSSESGFFDAKIKLADEDGECYSNKLQLHIERSPQ